MSLGLALTRTGGKLSKGPPVGLPLLAHPLMIANDKIEYNNFSHYINSITN
ncbi:MAG: hypothetical protein CM15mP102_02930 [Flavobacteriales bacterium]|nr:MAG: hypothetical protein CM15mP102_02930 [Flavobacteriales bacterium]